MYILNGKSLTSDQVITLIRASYDLTYNRRGHLGSIIGRRTADNTLWVVEISRPAEYLADVEAALRVHAK
jgi:hypothetical protein